MTGARVYRGGELIADRVVADIEIPSGPIAEILADRGTRAAS
jgi:hypothetical protein